MGRINNTIRVTSRVLGVVALSAAAVACGSEAADTDATASSGSTSAESSESVERPQIVVTTNILGDVVTAAVGSQADIEVIMPLGSDPHDFAASARQAESMENADLLIINGAGFEEGMLDLIANVSDTGTQVFSFADQIDLIGFSGDEEGDDHSDEEGDDHSDEEGDDHSDEEGDDHSDEEGDDHGHEDGDDPHIWTDPTRIATAVEALEPIISGLAGVDAAALSTSISDYLDKLSALDASMDKALSAVPEAQRVLITNHEVFGYFADRYDFEVVGAVIPSLTTNAEPSAADIEELAEMIEAESIPAIFGETTQSTQLADALADEVDGAVAVVELFSESLGEDGSGAETYVGMMQLNADLITKALTP
jgi:zinc/manganese transport system substrate-binding protein